MSDETQQGPSKRSWSKWYAEARTYMQEQYKRKRVRASDYRSAFDAGSTPIAAVDAMASRTADQREAPDGD